MELITLKFIIAVTIYNSVLLIDFVNLIFNNTQNPTYLSSWLPFQQSPVARSLDFLACPGEKRSCRPELPKTIRQSKAAKSKIIFTIVISA